MSIDKIIEQKELHRFDSESGVRNLCRLVGALGYNDPMRFGQFKDGCYGDLICFLEDNPGAVEAVIDWARDNEPWDGDETGDELDDDLGEE